MRVEWSLPEQGGLPPLELVAGPRTLGVLRRLSTHTQMRIYRHDGGFVVERMLEVGAHVTADGEGRLLVVSRQSDNRFSGERFDPGSVAGTEVFSIPTLTGERVLSAVVFAGQIALVTSERFINAVTGSGVLWSAILDPVAAEGLRSSRLYGAAVVGGDKVVLAWGADTTLGVAVLDSVGRALAEQVDRAFFKDVQYPDLARLAGHEDGAVLVHGNPIRATRIGLDASLTPLGHNADLLTFYRTTPQVGLASAGDRLFGFWLTVFPRLEAGQGTYPHDLYGCEIDLRPRSWSEGRPCVARIPLAEIGIGGYSIFEQPVAAVSLGGGRFAVTHVDADARTWLRIGDVGCAHAQPSP